MQSRRDRVILPIWILGTGLLALVSVTSVGTSFGTEAERASVVRLAVATPSLLAIRGLPDGTSLGATVFFQVFTYLAVLAALMSTFLVTRHTRADEERGRLELVRAASVGRITPLLATVSLAALANLATAALVAGALIAAGLPPGGSVITGVAVGVTGLAFAGTTALLAQVLPTGRAVNGAAGALVGLSFALRAAGDALGTPSADGLSITSTWPSWLSPIGWAQQTLAFTEADPMPLALSVLLAIVTTVAALAIQSRRDIDASLLQERAGRRVAGARLRSSLALAWRLDAVTIVAWTAGGALAGFFAGSISGIAAQGLDSDSAVIDLLRSFVPGGQGELTDLFVAAVLGIAGVLAAAAGVQAVIRARSEEADGRAELILAGAVSTRRWLMDAAITGAVSAVTVCAAAGTAAALAFLSAGEGADRAWSSLATGLAQIPAALAFVAVAVVILAVIPRVTGALCWSLLALGFVLAQFGGLLGLPDWVREISPFSQTPGLPAPDADWVGAGVLVIAAIVLVGAASALARRRELRS